MKVACLTDIGRARDINEDSCFCRQFANGWDLVIIADGMGGHNAGEVASKIAVQTIVDCVGKRMSSEIDKVEMEQILRNAIEQANVNIYDESLKDVNCSGMGTTVTMAVISQNCIIIGHVGDSRAYIYRSGTLSQITDDHSLVAELVKNGTITEDEAQHHPQKNVITRALGAKDKVDIDVIKLDMESPGILLICSDGLSNMLSDDEITGIISGNCDVSKTARNLIDAANCAGGLDNITVAVAEVTNPDGEVKQ